MGEKMLQGVKGVAVSPRCMLAGQEEMSASPIHLHVSLFARSRYGRRQDDAQPLPALRKPPASCCLKLVLQNASGQCPRVPSLPMS